MATAMPRFGPSQPRLIRNACCFIRDSSWCSTIVVVVDSKSKDKECSFSIHCRKQFSIVQLSLRTILYPQGRLSEEYASAAPPFTTHPLFMRRTVYTGTLQTFEK